MATLALDAPVLSAAQRRVAALIPDTLAPWIAGAAMLAMGIAAIVHPGTWPSSDLDAHVATIDLYRRSLLAGVVWPYDQGAAFGHDGTPYYGWWCELALGAVALVAGALGAAAPAVFVAKSAIVGALVALPIAGAWCARQLVPGTGASGRVIAHAGAFGAIAYLACANSDRISGIGIDAALSMGMVNQTIGLVLLLLIAGCSARVARGPSRRLHIPLALAVAAVLACHAQSALAASLVMLPALLWRPVATLVTGLAGCLLAAGSLSSLVVLGDRLMPLFPWHHLVGPDPVLAVLAPLLSETFSTTSSVAVLASCLLLALAFAGLRRASPVRDQVIAGLLVCACGTMPFMRVLMPPASQPYRFASLGLLLLLVAGAAQLGQVWPRWAARVRPPVRAAAVGVAWFGLLLVLAMQWREDEPGDTPAAAAAELHLGSPTSPVPPGSRVLAGDALGWHRWAPDALKQEAGWSMLNAGHSPSAPPTLAAAAAAGAGIGCPLAYPIWGEPMPASEAAAALRDLGVTHAVQIFSGAAMEMPVADLTAPQATIVRVASTPHARVWRVVDPAPILEPIGELGGLDLGSERRFRLFAADWWTRARAGKPTSARMVMAGPDDPGLSFAIATAPPLVLGRPYVLVDLAGLPPARAMDITWSSSTTSALAAAFGERMKPAAVWLQARPTSATATATITTPETTWSPAGNIARITGLTPGQPYLWRTAFSPGFTSTDGRVLEEVNGLTVIVPGQSTMIVRFSRITGTVIAATGLSFLVAVGLAAVAFRRREVPFPFG